MQENQIFCAKYYYEISFIPCISVTMLFDQNKCKPKYYVKNFGSYFIGLDCD